VEAIQAYQQLMRELSIRLNPIRPAESVNDHSTSGLGRLKTRRNITMPLFHPSCGNHVEQVVPRRASSLIIPYATSRRSPGVRNSLNDLMEMNIDRQRGEEAEDQICSI